MVDVVSSSVRSRMMAGIRGRDTQPEMLVRRYLHGHGFRYSLSRRDLPGRPDLVLTRHEVVVLVHGCYWHGHVGCRYATTPSTRREFWQAKISGNRERDARVVSELKELEWRIAIVWECTLRRNSEVALRRLERFVKSTRRQIEIGSPPQARRSV